MNLSLSLVLLVISFMSFAVQVLSFAVLQNHSVSRGTFHGSQQ